MKLFEINEMQPCDETYIINVTYIIQNIQTWYISWNLYTYMYMDYEYHILKLCFQPFIEILLTLEVEISNKHISPKYECSPCIVSHIIITDLKF